MFSCFLQDGTEAAQNEDAGGQPCWVEDFKKYGQVDVPDKNNEERTKRAIERSIENMNSPILPEEIERMTGLRVTDAATQATIDQKVTLAREKFRQTVENSKIEKVRTAEKRAGISGRKFLGAEMAEQPTPVAESEDGTSCWFCDGNRQPSDPFSPALSVPAADEPTFPADMASAQEEEDSKAQEDQRLLHGHLLQTTINEQQEDRRMPFSMWNLLLRTEEKESNISVEVLDRMDQEERAHNARLGHSAIRSEGSRDQSEFDKVMMELKTTDLRSSRESSQMSRSTSSSGLSGSVTRRFPTVDLKKQREFQASVL